MDRDKKTPDGAFPVQDGDKVKGTDPLDGVHQVTDAGLDDPSDVWVDVEPLEAEGPPGIKFQIPLLKKPSIHGPPKFLPVASNYRLVDANDAPKGNVVAGGVDLVSSEGIDDYTAALNRLEDGAVRKDPVRHSTSDTPVVPPMVNVGGNIFFPVDFKTESDAKAFVTRYVFLVQSACLRRGKTVHVIMHQSDFESVCQLAAEFDGSILYSE